MTRQNAIEELSKLTVADVMKRDVISVGSEQSMPEIAQLFLEHEFSAAPVVDERGQFIGMLTATDFLRRASDPDGPRVSHSEEGTGWEVTFGPDIVSSYVTRCVQTVAPETPLLRAAEVMAAERLHRLPVVGDEEQVVGIVSTRDVTTALLNALAEEKQESPILPTGEESIDAGVTDDRS